MNAFGLKIAEEFAERLNEFLDNGYNVDDLHLVGHSLGGQMVGKVGRQLQKITSGRLVIPRIYALDPAGKQKLQKCLNVG